MAKRAGGGPRTRVEKIGGEPAALCLRRFAVRIVDGPDAGRTAELAGERLRIGTAEANDLVVHDEFASRLHVEIAVAGDGFRLVDLGSKNGTFLGEHRVYDAAIENGDRIRVGRTEIVFQESATDVRLPLARSARFGRLVGRSTAMRRVFEVLARLAESDSTVLLSGETGTGKEEAARALHEAGPRGAGPFVAVNCGALPASLFASELFGHERGAFTGAEAQRAGAFERANGGTLLFDEVGELPIDFQPQLLRVLESREVLRLGGEKPTPIDVRIVAATNRDIRREVNAGRFRPDLYFRLAVVEVALPPLRERPEDVPLLVERLWEEIRTRTGTKSEPPGTVEVERLLGHYWPGNVRELKNALERMALLGADALPAPIAAPAEPTASARTYGEAKAEVLERFEKEFVADLLRRAGGNVTQAARDAKMDRKHLASLIKRHGDPK